MQFLRLIYQNIMDVVVLSILVLCLCSCNQTVHRVEFYEPTSVNAPYCVKSTDKSLGHGPLKSIEGKSGSPDFSDNKTFMLKINVLGL